MGTFSEDALRTQKAGLERVEIYWANVYLITQFLSPLTNHLRDQYGGLVMEDAKIIAQGMERPGPMEEENGE